jgi:hypothetical protein
MKTMVTAGLLVALLVVRDKSSLPKGISLDYNTKYSKRSKKCSWMLTTATGHPLGPSPELSSKYLPMSRNGLRWDDLLGLGD